MNDAQPIGEVTHYYGHLGVAVMRFTKSVKAGTAIHVRGATTDFTQTIDSMQFDHKAIEEAKKGQEVGVKVKEKVRVGDKVYEAEGER